MSHDVRFIRGLLGIWMIKIEHKKSLQMTASHILILDHQKGHKFIQGHLWKSYLLQKNITTIRTELLVNVCLSTCKNNLFREDQVVISVDK